MTRERDAVEPAEQADPLDILIDPLVRSSSRLLGRQSFPLVDLDVLPDGPEATLLRRHIPASALPLRSLRDALERLGWSLGRPAEPPGWRSPAVPLVTDPSSLDGSDPASRAARVVYHALLADPDLQRLGRRRAGRIAFLRAYDFRALCHASLPSADGVDDTRRCAARHAWAQSHAREFLHATGTVGPSSRCALAARLASNMVGRMQASAAGG